MALWAVLNLILFGYAMIASFGYVFCDCPVWLCVVDVLKPFIFDGMTAMVG